jgi:hypothetical protein
MNEDIRRIADQAQAWLLIYRLTEDCSKYGGVKYWKHKLDGVEEELMRSLMSLTHTCHSYKITPQLCRILIAMGGGNIVVLPDEDRISADFLLDT